MLVRIRFPQGHRIDAKSGKNRQIAVVAASLATMTAVASLLLGAWRLTADLEWTDPFFISTGIFSHWQVWFALTAALGAMAFQLRRYSRTEEETLETLPIVNRPEQ